MKPEASQILRYRHWRQGGAALVVGLVLMLLLTMLGVSGMNTATVELSISANSQAGQLAFQAAETGIEIALSGPVDTSAPYTHATRTLGDGGYSVEAEVRCVAVTRVTAGAYSETLGARAIHFDAAATGRGPRNAVTRLTQGFYVVGPGSDNAHYDPEGAVDGC